MTRTTRRLIFYGLVAIFLLATPPTILYATGYSFDWQKKVLVQTGGFYFKSLPADAEIIIDGKKMKTTPRLISRLLPKTYAVEITKDGYAAWRKSLEIEPRLVTEARNIVLFPQVLQPEKFAATVTTTIADWLKPAAEKEVYQKALSIASSSAGWLNKGNDIFYIDSANFIFYRQDFGGFIKEQLSKEPLPKNNYTLLASGNNRWLVLAKTGHLYLLDNDSGIFKALSDQAVDARWAGDNKKILIQTENELWILYAEDILLQPYKKAGETELITRLSQPIRQAVFYPDNEHIAFATGSQIRIIELDGRDSRNTIDLISAPVAQIYFDEPSAYFYYLTGGELFRIKP